MSTRPVRALHPTPIAPPDTVVVASIPNNPRANTRDPDCPDDQIVTRNPNPKHHPIAALADPNEIFVFPLPLLFSTDAFRSDVYVHVQQIHFGSHNELKDKRILSAFALDQQQQQHNSAQRHREYELVEEFSIMSSHTNTKTTIFALLTCARTSSIVLLTFSLSVLLQDVKPNVF